MARAPLTLDTVRETYAAAGHTLNDALAELVIDCEDQILQAAKKRKLSVMLQAIDLVTFCEHRGATILESDVVNLVGNVFKKRHFVVSSDRVGESELRLTLQGWK